MTQNSLLERLLLGARWVAANSANAPVNSPAPANGNVEHQLPFVSSMDRAAALTANPS